MKNTKSLLSIAAVMLAILLASCTLNRIDQPPTDIPSEEHILYIDYAYIREKDAGFMITSDDKEIQKLLPDEMQYETLKLRNIPVGTELKFTFTVNTATQGCKIAGFRFKTPSSIDETPYYATANEDLSEFTITWKTTHRSEVIDIDPIYFMNLVLEQSNFSGTITTDIGDSVRFADSDQRQDFRLRIISSYDIKLDDITDVGFDDNSKYEILFDNMGVKHITYQDHMSYGFEPRKDDELEILSITKEVIRSILVRAPGGFDIEYQIPNYRTGFIEKGHSYSVPLPYKQKLHLSILDPQHVIEKVNWKSVSDSTDKKVIVSWDDLLKLESIEPEVSVTSHILSITEPSAGFFVTVSDKDGNVQTGSYMNGKTTYKFSSNSEVVVTANDPEGYIFTGWGTASGFEGNDKELRFTLNATFLELEPLFLTEAKEPGVYYVAPSPSSEEFSWGAIPGVELGTEANPYEYIEDALLVAEPGDEIRLLSGMHVINEPLRLEHGITISGGWRQGKGRQEFKYSVDGKGSPQNLSSTIFLDYLGNEEKFAQDCIYIPEGNRDPVIFDGVTLKLGQMFYPSDSIIGIHGEHATKLIFNDSIIWMDSAFGGMLGILSTGTVDMKNSSVIIPRGGHITGVSIQNDLSTLHMDSCRIIIGSENAAKAQGVSSNSNNGETLIVDNVIAVASGDRNKEGYSSSGPGALAVTISSGKVLRNIITVDAGPGRGRFSPVAPGQAITSSEQSKDLVIEGNYIFGHIAMPVDIEYAPFISVKGGRTYFANNMIDFADCTSPVNIIRFESNESLFIGNWIHAGKISNFTNMILLDGSRSLVINNTLRLDGIVEPTGKPSQIIAAYRNNYYDEDGFIIAMNNMIGYGPDLSTAVGITTCEDPRNLIVNNCFIDFKSPDATLGMTAAPIRVKIDEAESVFLSLEDAETTVYGEWIHDNFGEDAGVDVPGYDYDVTGYVPSELRPYLMTDVKKLRSGGITYSKNRLNEYANRIGMRVPDIKHNSFALFYDINGQPRKPETAIGAIQPLF